MIAGVKIHTVTTHNDKRGFFREIFRFSTGYNNLDVGQLSHSLVNEGIVKAWHAHKFQHQWNYVINGELRVALYDNRRNSDTYQEKMKLDINEETGPIAYFFPSGVLHGYRCLKGPMNIIYCTTGIYDLDDEIRIENKSLISELL